MRGRIAALIVASAVTTGAMATSATAAGGPPPAPKGAAGVKVQLFASGLMTPTSFAFGAGNVFEGDGGSETSQVPNGGVFLLRGGAATKLAGSPNFVAGLAWHRSALYISGASVTSQGIKFQLLAWSGWNGSTFTKQKVIYTAPKGFDGFNGLAFGPDGRLYVGVDVGLTNGNDHGKATKKTPFLYDILSIKSNGKGLKVFASGMRQPWQFAFAKGSSAPFVSDLGQDKGAKNPPDFVLKVHKGDNYGFPKCNWTASSKCKGFTKPFQDVRAPHRHHGTRHHRQDAVHDIVCRQPSQVRQGPVDAAERWHGQNGRDRFGRSVRRTGHERRLALRRRAYGSGLPHHAIASRATPYVRGISASQRGAEIPGAAALSSSKRGREIVARASSGFRSPAGPDAAQLLRRRSDCSRLSPASVARPLDSGCSKGSRGCDTSAASQRRQKQRRSASGQEVPTRGDHRFGSLVDGLNDLGVVDSAGRDVIARSTCARWRWMTISEIPSRDISTACAWRS